MNKLLGTNRMMFGEHEGKMLHDVPASYLIWIYNNLFKLRGDMRTYIEENMEDLKKEAELEPKRRSK
jgi:uncharacterized protein (DUF3820 family)